MPVPPSNIVSPEQHARLDTVVVQVGTAILGKLHYQRIQFKRILKSLFLPRTLEPTYTG